jgi:hypothetical protein
MTNPRNREQDQRDDNSEWKRKHHNVQRIIAWGGLAGLCILILQWCQMRDSLHTDQRAWVTVATAILLKEKAVDEKPEVEIKVFNSGKTPALEVKILGSVYLAADEPGSVNFGDVSKYPSAVIGPAAPPTSIILERPPLGELEVLALSSNANNLYAHGEIRYVDIFGKHHTTGFCFCLRQKDVKAAGPVVMNACETGNWAN